MIDQPLRNNLQMKPRDCNGTETSATIVMKGVRLTTQGNVAIGYDDDGKSECKKTSLAQCRYRTVYEYPDESDKIETFAKGVLFDDLYRNYIGGNIEKYASGSSSNASKTSPNHPCFGALAVAELSNLYGPAQKSKNGSSPATPPPPPPPAPPAAVYHFGACSMTCDALTGRLYTYLKDQLPHAGTANFLRSIKYVYAGLILIFLFVVVFFTVVKSEGIEVGPFTVRPKVLLLVSITAILTFLVAQMVVLEPFRTDMDGSGARYGISYQIVGTLIGAVAWVSGLMVTHEDMAKMFSGGGYMRTLL